MSIAIERDQDGIVTLVLDMPDRTTNVLNGQLLGPFSLAVENLCVEKGLSGVILTSAKKDFIAGADIDLLFSASNPQDVTELAEHFKGILRKMETMGKPVVAALNGTALGGGFEVALACHHRIAIDHPGIRFGLPEVTLGVLPGGGGTQRLPRLIGVQAALPFLLEGRSVPPSMALKAGLVDSLVKDRDELMAQAKSWILNHPDAQQPWDQKGFRWPEGNPRHPKIAQVWAVTPAILKKKTRGNYPAARFTLASVCEGSMVDFDTGSRIESRYFAAAATSQEAKNMIRAFWYQLNQIKKGESRPSAVAPTHKKKIGILGAGMMGAGIAYEAARHGLKVVLKDVSLDVAEKGKQYSAKILDKAIQKGKKNEEQKKEILNRILPTTQAQDLEGCDLIVEAVFEDRSLKAQVTEEAESHMDPGGVFASNTSTLPISGLAEASTRPDRFIGLHFFSPVEKMKLVEIIVGRQTSPNTLAEGFDFVQQIGKTPIVVNDSRGFYTSRVFSTYVLEGASLLGEGHHPRRIEVAGMAAGMPVGPLAISDEISLSLMVHIDSQTRRDLEAEGLPYTPHPGHQVIRKMVEQLNRKGRKSGGGFYDYPKTEKKRLWPDLRTHFKKADVDLSHEEMMQRLMFIQALEAARCHQEGVVRNVADANIGSIFGWGFAPFKGGALQFINDYGLKDFLQESHRLAATFGPRFSPPELIQRMASRGESFE